MNRICLILFLLLAAESSWAQKAFIFNSQQKNGFLSFSLGTSQPLGTFGKRTADADENGLALRGQTWSVMAGYRLAGPLGLMGRYEETQNGIDTKALAAAVSQTPNDNVEGSTAAGQAGRWQSRSLMAGPFVTIPLGRLVLDIRTLAGQAWAICPATIVQGKLNQTETLIRTENQEAKALASGMGLSLRFRVSPVVALHVNGDYSTARFTFANVLHESRRGNVSQQQTHTSQKTLSSATLSTGLTIQFRARNQVF
ncbi:hypothetical protein J2I47_04970 [Fibrella sp. HMF5335]|uniref:Outer membrane protein beta-barrel domain-containing protein n=1 Tax=Fibrella rubiginis TaxID=2817060 RepID=A0A939GDQ9_9BACT|nr:hypothetical protein [Fibrella rubiginis]MBO0935893.1 hypothetical protein [Fibrella rubiginis]